MQTEISKKIDKEIGARLKSMRLRKRWRLIDIGEIVGVSYQQVQKYELGINQLPASSMVLIAEEMNCSIVNFFRD